MLRCPNTYIPECTLQIKLKKNPELLTEFILAPSLPAALHVCNVTLTVTLLWTHLQWRGGE